MMSVSTFLSMNKENYFTPEFCFAWLQPKKPSLSSWIPLFIPALLRAEHVTHFFTSAAKFFNSFSFLFQFSLLKYAYSNRRTQNASDIVAHSATRTDEAIQMVILLRGAYITWPSIRLQPLRTRQRKKRSEKWETEPVLITKIVHHVSEYTIEAYLRNMSYCQMKASPSMDAYEVYRSETIPCIHLEISMFIDVFRMELNFKMAIIYTAMLSGINNFLRRRINVKCAERRLHFSHANTRLPV